MKKLAITLTTATFSAMLFGGCSQGQREAVCDCAEDYGADWDDCAVALKAKAKGDCGMVEEEVCLDPKNRATCHYFDVKINCDGVDSKKCKNAIKDLSECVEYTGCIHEDCWDKWEALDADCGIKVWEYCVGVKVEQTVLPPDADTNPQSTCLQGAFYDLTGVI